MINCSRGSEWRKWDLHIHTPFTKSDDEYKCDINEDVWDIFCKKIEESDVAVIGITDYFSIENFYLFKKKHQAKYPDSNKIFFPNIELRLNESVNQAQEEVNLHIIFKPDISAEQASKFLSELKTEVTDGNNRKLSCAELQGDQFKSATVTRESISTAIKNTFGDKSERQNHLLIITAANNDGVRPTRGRQRKENITDQIDKFSDAYFGGSQNTEYFLKTNRLEDDDQTIKPKPVFTGSDIHSFDQLDAWLGRRIENEDSNKEITWIKCDPNFGGLLQTLIEPKERVCISPTKPDQKELHKVIKQVTFSGSKDFPSESIVLNSNLCSIIGSRSSGKSALLAYIAYSINKEETVARQMDVNDLRIDEVGPAAGKTWKDVSGIKCEVEWGSGVNESGRVVYIPQNYLYSISNRPIEITSKIKPVLFSRFPVIEVAYNKVKSEIENSNLRIENAINQWFVLSNDAAAILNSLKNIGEKSAITKSRDEYQRQIDELKNRYSITEEEIGDYQKITQIIAQKRSRQQEIKNENMLLTIFIDLSDQENNVKANISAAVSFEPSLDKMPRPLAKIISDSAAKQVENISVEAKLQILKYYQSLLSEHKLLETEITQLETDNKDLIEKNKKNDELAKLIENVNKQNSYLSAIEDKEKLSNEKVSEISDQVKIIEEAITTRSTSLENLKNEFKQIDQKKEEIVFGVECSFSENVKMELADRFNKNNTSNFLDSKNSIDLEKIRLNITEFLSSLYTGSQKLKSGQEPKQVAKDMLVSSEEIRFNAILEGDKIGGFERSSMTPGKRALFALTLMLSEIDGAWPLLIDQPEDDLDSRSIYDQIVPYLIERKKERQIIMVSHNANLVIGADSEQIIVANKHGNDRKNKDDQTFNYLTGSLEYSKSKCVTTCVLDSCGIREHACEILDGGEEAFEKRRNKYNI